MNLQGARLGKYELRAEIGRGGMGAVYQGYDPILNRSVAVKVLYPHLTQDRQFVERFLREARAAASFDHPHIVTVYDAGEEGGWYYFVMRYLEGRPLSTLLRERGRLPPEQALAVLRQLAGALDYAHDKGMVHRDVKPANAMVDQRGRVTLTDFGLVRAAQESRMTSTGTVLGTPQYMSPEQASGKQMVGAASDLYSLAVMAYEMLCGEVPFDADSTPGILYQQVHEPPPPIAPKCPDLPTHVDNVLRKALAKEPEERYPSGAAFAAALAGALGSKAQPVAVSAPAQTAAVGRAGSIRSVPQLTSSTRWAWIAGAVVMLALAGLVLIVLGGRGAKGAAARPTGTAAPTEPPRPTVTPSTPLLGSSRPRTDDGMVMVYVPAAEFEMGSTDGDDDEQTVHKVTLDDFWTDRTEVTNTQFAAFLNENGNQTEDGVTWLDLEDDDSLIERVGGAYRPRSGYADHPAIEVSWYGARAYCDWAGGRLPTEAEWEYAARGPQGSVYPWGDAFECSRGNFDDETQIDETVVAGGEGCDGYETTAPVGSFETGTGWAGALDMAGNVWEWVNDWYGDYPSAAQVNPTGPERGEFRVLRGGSWQQTAFDVRSAGRAWLTPDGRRFDVGFRRVVSGRSLP